MREAGMYLAEQELVDVAALERVLGHFTWAFLVARPLYSIFSSIYEYIRINQGRCVPWWPSARAELDLESRLVHFASLSLRRTVAPLLLVTDAEA